MALLLRHFWLVGIAIVLLNGILGYHRARVIVAEGQASQQESLRFATTIILALVGFFLVLGVAQAIDRQPSSLCLADFPPRTAGSVLMWAATFLLSGLALAWVWRGNGADLIGRLGPAYLRGPAVRRFRPQTVRLVVSAVFVIGPITNLLLHILDPSRPTFCEL